MPIFEYRCDECSSDFELLQRSDTVPECPHCGSGKLTKQLSVFATASAGASPPAPAMAGGCGGCGQPGMSCPFQ